MNKRSIYIIIAIAIIGMTATHYWYYSPDQVSERQMQAYQQEINSLSGSIERDRLNRAELKAQWKIKDDTLSGAINTAKERMDILDNCIRARSFPCDKADRKAVSFLLGTAYAGESTETSSLLPVDTKSVDYSGITNFRNDFECEKRNKTVAIEYHFTAENYEKQDTNETKLLSIWNAHTSKSGKIRGDGIGYHYVIAKDGQIFSTRNKQCRAIADAGYEKELMSNENTEHIHIAFISDDKPTVAQTKSMISLGQQLINEFGLSRESITSHAENAPKNHKEMISYWYGSKINFIQNFSDAKDKKVIVSRNGKVNEAATYAWNTYKDMDFMLTIDAESSWNYDTIGDKDNPKKGDYAVGFCQFNTAWHKDKIRENENLSTQGKVDYCRAKYVQWKKDGVIANMLHGYGKRMSRAGNLTFN